MEFLDEGLIFSKFESYIQSMFVPKAGIISQGLISDMGSALICSKKSDIQEV